MANKYRSNIICELLMELSQNYGIFICLKSNDSNADKIKFIYNHILVHIGPPKVMPRLSKCVGRSNMTRNRGNAKLNTDRYQALEHYNECIAVSQNDSEELSIAYANRSAIYFEWQMYAICLQNIELARSITAYPRELDSELLKREENCRAFLTSDNGPPIYDVMRQYKYQPNLTHKSHPRASCISEALCLQDNANYGRFFTATQSLKPGDIIAIESSPARVLDPAYVFRRCANCLAENELNLIPCPHCTLAMFCSQQCLDEAIKGFHGFECPIIDYILTVFTGDQIMAIRLCIEAFQCFDSANQLKDFIGKFGDIKSNMFSPLPNKNITERQRIFHQMYSLETHQSKRQPADYLVKLIFSALAYDQLIKHTRFRDICSDEGSKSILMELLMRFVQTSTINRYGHRMLDSPEVCSSGVYPVCSFFNHSCASNLTEFVYGSKLVVMVKRPVKAGEQLFVTYGPDHFYMNLRERQTWLDECFFFKCDCVACQNNYPLIDGRLAADNARECDKFVGRRSHELDEDLLVNGIKDTVSFLKENDSAYPHGQMGHVLELFKKYHFVLLGNVSLKSKKICPETIPT